LQEFEQRQQAGEAPAQINKAELVDGEFRYMQAQAAAPLCLTCHGTDIPSEVSEALARLDPNDMATGYLAGQIRGAISLRAPN
jgi:cytochrome c553